MIEANFQLGNFIVTLPLRGEDVIWTESVMLIPEKSNFSTILDKDE